MVVVVTAEKQIFAFPDIR